MAALDALMQQAVRLHQQGQWSAAEALYRQAAELFPAHPGVLNLLGTLLAQQERFSEALPLLQQALALQPHQPEWLVNLAEATHRHGDTPAAVALLEQALALKPDLAVAHYNLANLLKIQADLPAALAHYKQALTLRPDQAEYHYNYGNTLMAVGHFRSARAAFARALELRPQHASAHNNLGTLLLEDNAFALALHHYQQAVRYQPEFNAAWKNLAQYHEANDEREQARRALRRCSELSSELLSWREANLLPLIPADSSEIDQALTHWTNSLESLRDLRPTLAQAQEYQLDLPSILTYYGREDLALRRRYAEVFRHFEGEPPATGHARPRLGCVVTRGHEGVFLKCMAGVFRQLSPAFEWVMVCSRPNGRKILEPALPGMGWLELSSELPLALKQLQEARFDLLYYWEVGTDCFNYFLPFFRPARIQVTGWGWPVSSGIPGLDYYLSAEGLEAPGAEAHYSEQLLRLPRLPVFYPAPPVPAQAAELSNYGLAPGQRLYLCSQNLRKIQPGFERLLAGILSADPQAVICLLGDKRPALTERLEQRLRQQLPEAGARLRILPRLQPTDYLALVKAAAVMLDTTAYSGGANTNYDAFAAGTPVVTLPGILQRSRYTQAALEQIDAPALIASDASDYIARAVAIAQNPDLRQQHSATLLERQQEVIADVRVAPLLETCLAALL